MTRRARGAVSLVMAVFGFSILVSQGASATQATPSEPPAAGDVSCAISTGAD